MENFSEPMGFLIDNTKCMGCRACQTACKQWNNLPAEKTVFFGGPGYQNPKDLSDSTFTLIKFREVIENNKIKDWGYWKKQCQHCIDPSCKAACTAKAIEKIAYGPVIWDEAKCITGCSLCKDACPFNIPRFGDNHSTKIRKCTMCYDRIEQGIEPACSKACPTDATIFGELKDLLAIAEKRISSKPEVYHQYIYGKEEVGGTSVLYISGFPLEDIGYPDK
ncbi:MAG: hypothetical protein A2033_19435 [Bacteroidetes bacterium GWA2_31_9]|nr:MAG: hypothetical protein A2033_19435 [Bacteroidetes bacterium GWA2_31_9]